MSTCLHTFPLWTEYFHFLKHCVLLEYWIMDIVQRLIYSKLKSFLLLLDERVYDSVFAVGSTIVFSFWFIQFLQSEILIYRISGGFFFCTNWRLMLIPFLVTLCGFGQYCWQFGYTSWQHYPHSHSGTTPEWNWSHWVTTIKA